MSSHHEWADEVIARHEAEKPFAPENGQPLLFSPGDVVIHTNEYGAKSRHTITGYFKPGTPSTQYANGARYLLDWDCHWVPVAEACLQLDAPAVASPDEQ